MIHYIVRRLLFAVPTLAAISFILFALLDLAPNDPTGQLPLTIPAEAREQIRESLGLGEPFHIRYAKWMEQFFVNEPLNLIEQAFGLEIGDSESRLRVRSWATRSPVVDLIVERLPQTLWVVGLSYLIGILIAVPIGIVSAYRQYSWFDQLGTFVSMIGFSVPTFFTGLLAIILFSVTLQWLPSIYDTTHRGHRPRELLGADQADGYAGDGARALQRGADQPLHAGRRARQSDAGLCAHRPRQGAPREGRAVHPRAAQQPDSGGNSDRARHPPPSSAAPSSPRRYFG